MTCLGRVLARVVRVRLSVMLVRVSVMVLLCVSVLVLFGAGSLYTSIPTRGRLGRRFRGLVVRRCRNAFIFQS